MDVKNIKQIESDFAVHWLGKFAQVILALLPSVVFSFYPAFTRTPNFIFILCFSVVFGWLIYELVGKSICRDDENIVAHYFTYLVGYAALNILNLSEVNSIPSNLTLTTLLVLQSISSKNFGYAVFGVITAYLTTILHFVLPHSTHFSASFASLKVHESSYMVVLFSLFVYLLFRLSKMKEPEKEEISYSAIAANSIIFTVIFGFLFAGRNDFLWGIFLIVLGFAHLISGMFFYTEFQHKRYSHIWFYFFAVMAVVGTFLVTRQWEVILCWELIALSLALLSRLPQNKPMQFPAFLMFQLAFIFFLISEPFAKFFHLDFNLNLLLVLIISIFFYAISFHLKDIENSETPLITTFQSEMALIIAIPFLFSNNIISIVWAAIGFCLIPLGFVLKDSALRTGGIGILLIVILKVLIGDTISLSSSNLALSLTILAPILMATSLIYLKFRDTGFRPNIIVDKAHSLSIEEATSRLDGLIQVLESKYASLFSDLSKKWEYENNLMDFSFNTYGMHILGKIKVEQEKAILEVKIPLVAMIFKHQIVDAVYKEIGNLLEQESQKELYKPVEG